MKYRSLVSAFLCAGLAGCSTGDSDYAQMYQILRQAVRQTVGDDRITLEQAAKIPYASMGWRLNGGPENIIVLATDSGGEQLWTSSAHVVLVTRDGRIVRTVGLPVNMATLTPQSGPAIPAPSHALQGPYTDRRIADFPDAGLYAVAISCRSQMRGTQTITILGNALTTVRVEENCQSAQAGWNFTNRFWIDRDSGFVWRSEQAIHPGKGVLQTEIFRQPG